MYWADRSLKWLAVCTMSAALAGCGGTGSDAGASSSAGTAASTTPASRAAPQLDGEPMNAVRVGELFYFVPEPNGGDDAAEFSAYNLPSWMRLNPITGELNGMPQPEDVGLYKTITLQLKQGGATSTLVTFDVEVSAIASGSAQLSWSSPQQNTNGGNLSLAGYRIRYGRSARALNQSIAIGNPSVTDYTVENLSTGTWYFDVVAISGEGAESAPSNMSSKRI